MSIGKTISMLGLLTSSLLAAKVHAACPPGAPPGPLCPDETNLIVIIDVTGSMATPSGSVAPGEPPKTKLEIARLAAIDYLINDTGSLVSPEYAVWEFSGDTYQVKQDFASNPLLSVAAIGSTAQTTDLTPLAGTLCSAVDRLRDYESTKMIVDPVTGRSRRPWIERRIFLTTDGSENNTTTSSECYGPHAVTETLYPNYDFGSWQWKVLNKLKTGQANTPSTAPFEYIIDVEHILTSFLTSSMALAATPFALAAPALPAANDVDLLRGLAVQSRGRYHQLAPNPKGVVSFRTPGDADSNGCVDMTDYQLLLSAFGKRVDTTNKSTLQADFNGDAWVDDKDYMLLIQHWNEGC